MVETVTGVTDESAAYKSIGQRLLMWNTILVAMLLPVTIWFQVSGFLFAPGVLIMFIAYFALSEGGGASGSQATYRGRAMTGAVYEAGTVGSPMVLGIILAGTWIGGAILGYLVELLLF